MCRIITPVTAPSHPHTRTPRTYQPLLLRRGRHRLGHAPVAPALKSQRVVLVVLAHHEAWLGIWVGLIGYVKWETCMGMYAYACTYLHTTKQSPQIHTQTHIQGTQYAPVRVYSSKAVPIHAAT